MTAFSRRHVLAGGLGLAAGGALTAAPFAQVATAAPPGGQPHGDRFSARVLHRWAADTWNCLVAMTEEDTGLTADNIESSIRNPVRSGYTSPTNIGGYLWCAIVARELELISARECSRRIRQTLRTLGRIERHEPSGQYYNWYDEETGDYLTTWPSSGDRVYPFCSSVDNGWLAAALVVVRNADPANSAKAAKLLDSMNFGMYYNDAEGVGASNAGLLKGGFWPMEPQPGQAIVDGNFLGNAPDVHYTGFHYDTTVSETRIASYLGIARGQIPAKHYFGTYRAFPPGKFDGQEQTPTGQFRTYLGVEVFEGAYEYRGMHLACGWGGSMFEALMPNMFVPEERWAPRSWGVNHPLTVRAQREHGLIEAGYGYWGFSPASDPTQDPGYSEYGVDAIGMNPDGYFSDVEKTNYDYGDGTTPPSRTFGDGVVTPHALFLALHHEPQQAYANLRKLQRNFGSYGRGGFYDAIAVGSGQVARRYLSLDQAMVLGSIGNVIGGGIVRKAFCEGEIRRRIKPLIAMERFGSRPR